jgi:pimeloyl-ACP methyl ester carboxylesterase
MPFFRNEGHRLSYTSFGDGPRTVVLVHGLLFSQKMHRPLAEALATRGNRVITLDLLGHGASDRPRDMTAYSMSIYGQQVLALLDHLEIEQAVVGGTSLGANATLEATVDAPDRVRGMLVEMPVLDNALLGCALAFTPLLVSLTFGRRSCARSRWPPGECPPPPRRCSGPTCCWTSSARSPVRARP